MILFRLKSQQKQYHDLKEIVEHLSLGKIAAIPTETFYALSANPFHEEAVKKIFSIKRRFIRKPILLLISSQKEVYNLTSEIPDHFEHLASKFWPGSLTLVMKSSSNVPPWIDGSTGKVGLRVPGKAITRTILEQCPFPLTGTSANRSGEVPLQSDKEVIHHFKNDLDLMIMAGRLPGGLPSTLLDITARNPVLLREGSIKRAEIEKALKRKIDLK